MRKGSKWDGRARDEKNSSPGCVLEIEKDDQDYQSVWLSEYSIHQKSKKGTQISPDKSTTNRSQTNSECFK